MGTNPRRRRGRQLIFSRPRPRLKANSKESVKEILVRQVDVAFEALDVANQVLSREASAQASRKTMRTIEHEGDDARIDLAERVNVAFTVPLEREDLIRASRALDDITDNLRDMVREMAKWEVKPGLWSRDALAPGEDALAALRAAVEVAGAEDSRNACLTARFHAGQLRRKYQNGLTRVFADDLTMDTLKQREVLRRIDTVGVLLTNAADALLDGIVKRYV